MRRKSNKTRLGQFGDYWLSKNPDRNKATDSWCRTWYDSRGQQTRRESLGTADFGDASKLLARQSMAFPGTAAAEINPYPGVDKAL